MDFGSLSRICEWKVLMRWLLLMSLAGGGASAQPWTYDIHYRALQEQIEVRAEFSGVSALRIDPAAQDFVRGVELLEDGHSKKLAFDNGSWSTDACVERCTIRYTFDLGKASLALESSDILGHGAGVHIVKPGLWLLRPKESRPKQDVVLRFSVAGAASYATGMFAGVEKNSYQATVDQLDDLPWTVLGPFNQHLFKVTGSNIKLAIVPANYRASYTQIVAWTKRAIDAMIAYYGRFPVPQALIIVGPRERFKGPGRSFGNGGAVTFNPLSLDADEADLREDWVMTHEMVHLAFPSVPYAHHWIEEGLATYVEPIARVRSGELRAERVFRDMIVGMPKGLPRDGDRGLDFTASWGRTYWGGALFCLLADKEIRERSKGKVGLEDALRAIVDQGGSLAVNWDLEKALAIGDRATGYPVLLELYEQMKNKPLAVDLDDLWKKLGVEMVGGEVVFNDKASLAYVRNSMISTK